MRSRWTVTGALALLAVMVAVCACCADQQYMEESLFVIPWGDGPGTVGIVPQPGEGGARATGPCGLQVDRHGNLWLLDRRHLALTCFSPEGEPLQSLTFMPDGSCDSAVIEVVAADGRDPRVGRIEINGLTGSISLRMLTPIEQAEQQAIDDEAQEAPQ